MISNSVKWILPSAITKKERTVARGMDDFPFFVASVNGARLFKNPQTQELWTADMHRDAIRIYNDSLKQIRELVGPDHFFTGVYPEANRCSRSLRHFLLMNVIIMLIRIIISPTSIFIWFMKATSIST